MGDGIVLRRHEGAWIQYNESHGLPFSYIYCLAQGVGGEIWAGSHEQGLFVFRDGRFHAVPGTEASTRAVIVSSDGVVWVGTQSEGLNRLTLPRVMAYSLGAATELGEVNGIAEDPPGQFWVATWGGGLQRGPLEALEWVTDVPELREYPFLRSCLRAKNGDLYIIGSQQVGRWNAGPGVLSFTPTTDAIVISACEDADGDLLLGGRDGILRRLTSGVMEPVPNGNFSAPILYLVRGKGSGVWAATQGAGLFRWEAGKVEHWTTAEGLPTDLLRALHEDAQGTLWIGTGGGGLAWLKKGRMHSLDSRQGLTNDAICPILEDDDGHLWLGSIRGISRVSKLELFDVAEGRAAAVHPLVLDESDGMPSAECTSGYGPAGLRSESGLLLFSTTRHIVAVDPKKFTASAPPPKVLIESIVADGKPMRSSTRELSFSPGLREVSIEYTAFNYTKPDRIRFRYRLTGMQNEWMPVGERRVARFALLPPGHYTFEVSAANEDGRWNKTGASLSFAVRPFFWQTGWFRFGMVLLLMASGGGVVAWWARIHIRRAQAREKLARAEAEVQLQRNEVAHLMRVASVGELSSAIAHELKQPLTAILSNAQAAQRFIAQDKSDMAEVHDILQDIVTDDERAMDVIHRLRSLLKKGEFKAEALDVNGLIHDVVRLMQGEMTARRISVATALTAGLAAGARRQGATSAGLD